MGSSEIAKCKGIWKIEICFNNALPHGFHCASYHHTNKLEKHCSISSSPRTSNSSLNRPKAGKLPAKGEIATTEEMGKYLENTSLKSCASGLEPSELTSVSKETLHNCACSLRAALWPTQACYSVSYPNASLVPVIYENKIMCLKQHLNNPKYWLICFAKNTLHQELSTKLCT